jgi:hypothetical protein
MAALIIAITRFARTGIRPFAHLLTRRGLAESPNGARLLWLDFDASQVSESSLL